MLKPSKLINVYISLIRNRLDAILSYAFRRNTSNPRFATCPSTNEPLSPSGESSTNSNSIKVELRDTMSVNHASFVMYAD